MDYEKDVAEAQRIMAYKERSDQRVLNLIKKLSDVCKLMDKELDLVHNTLTEIYNSSTESVTVERIKELMNVLEDLKEGGKNV